MAPFSHPFGAFFIGGLRLGALPQQLAQGILDRFLLESLEVWEIPLRAQIFVGNWMAILGKKKWRPTGFLGGFVSIIFSPMLGEMIQVDSYFLAGLKPPTSFKFQDVSRSFFEFLSQRQYIRNLNHWCLDSRSMNNNYEECALWWTFLVVWCDPQHSLYGFGLGTLRYYEAEFRRTNVDNKFAPQQSLDSINSSIESFSLVPGMDFSDDFARLRRRRARPSDDKKTACWGGYSWIFMIYQKFAMISC